MNTSLTVTIVAQSAEALRLRNHVLSCGILSENVHRIAALNEFHADTHVNTLLLFSTIDSDVPLFVSLDTLYQIQQSGTTVFLLVTSFDDYCIAQSHGMRNLLYDCDGYAPLQQLTECIERYAVHKHNSTPHQSADLIEKEDLLRLAERMIELRLPDTTITYPWLKSAATWLSSMVRHDDSSPISLDTLLNSLRILSIARLSLPDAKKKSPCTIDGHGYDSMLMQLPLISETVLQGISSLDNERHILRSLYENYDGTGFPNKSQHWQIPLASRILRPLVEMIEYKINHSCSLIEAFTSIKRFQRIAYDPRIIMLIEEYITMVDTETGNDVSTVELDKLEDGMILARDIVTNSGMKLLNAGTTLHSSLIARIQSHNTLDAIVGNVYITTIR